MKSNAFFSLLILAAIFAQSTSAQTYNPKPGWKDSYSVGGKCYCDSSNFDHGLDQKTANTPAGVKKVTQICADIKRVLGTGPTSGRIPYNDIQCGNGPANDAPDEAGCPGRVDIGSKGCNQIGPKWDLASVYGNSNPPPPSNPNPSGWRFKASAGASEAKNTIDGISSSRWTTRGKQKSGQFFEVDMQQQRDIRQITLDSSQSPKDYPRDYQVYVSRDGTNWGSPVAAGNGKNAVTVIQFPKQNARHIRIVQTGSDSFYWWSIHELSVE